MGHLISFRGNCIPSEEGIGTLNPFKKCSLLGNCMSLLFGDNASTNYSLIGYDYAFHDLFFANNYIQHVSENFLPATTLSIGCYNAMFHMNIELVTPPSLPADTLATRCYDSMFQYCSKLTTAPELPAITLADYCYNGMFRGCTALTTAPELPAITLVT